MPAAKPSMWTTIQGKPPGLVHLLPMPLQQVSNRRTSCQSAVVKKLLACIPELFLDSPASVVALQKLIAGGTCVWGSDPSSSSVSNRNNGLLPSDSQ